VTDGVVTAVSRSATHSFGKPVESSIRLLGGLGVEGDAHAGETVKHRSRVRQDPSQPNLRQVHLIHAELHDELKDDGQTCLQTLRGLAVATMREISRLFVLRRGRPGVSNRTGLGGPES
jgi:hypothetical protein